MKPWYLTRYQKEKQQELLNTQLMENFLASKHSRSLGIILLPTGICNKQPISWPEGSQEAVVTFFVLCPALSPVSFDFAQQSSTGWKVYRELVGNPLVRLETR